MIAAILGKLGIEGALKLGRSTILMLAIVGLLATAALGFWRGMARIEAMVETARIEERVSRDNHWKAEIAASNLKVAQAEAAAIRAAEAATREADNKITGLQAALTEMETRNAALPNGARCGLDAGRVRLLNR